MVHLGHAMTAEVSKMLPLLHGMRSVMEAAVLEEIIGYSCLAAANSIVIRDRELVPTTYYIGEQVYEWTGRK